MPWVLEATIYIVRVVRFRLDPSFLRRKHFERAIARLKFLSAHNPDVWRCLLFSEVLLLAVSCRWLSDWVARLRTHFQCLYVVHECELSLNRLLTTHPSFRIPSERLYSQLIKSPYTFQKSSHNVGDIPRLLLAIHLHNRLQFKYLFQSLPNLNTLDQVLHASQLGQILQL